MPDPGRLRRLLEKDLETVRSDPVNWVLLLGNRLLIAGLLTGLFAILAAAVMRTRLVTIANTGQMVFLAQGLLTSTVTLVTIVLAINQMVLSQEFRSPGQLHDYIQDTATYRRGVEKTTTRDAVPTTPADFLTVLLDATRTNAQRLGGAVEGREHDRLHDEVDTLVSSVTSNTDEITDMLAGSERGIFSTLAASLESNFSRQLNEAHRLQSAYGDELPLAARRTLDTLMDNLQQVDIARQYFKSIYIQSELARLSRLLLYAGVPAIGGAILMYYFYAGHPNDPVASAYLPAFSLLVVVLSFSAVALLCSYVLRIATVAQRTVAITPFTRPESATQFGEEPDENREPEG